MLTIYQRFNSFVIQNSTGGGVVGGRGGGGVEQPFSFMCHLQPEVCYSSQIKSNLVGTSGERELAGTLGVLN